MTLPWRASPALPTLPLIAMRVISGMSGRFPKRGEVREIDPPARRRA
jgi:hypothetical protein